MRILLLTALAASCWAGPGQPYRLRTEALENPLGIDEPRPRFTWALAHDARGQMQSAYRVQVSGAEDFGIVAWDSDWTASAVPAAVYGGRTLAARVRYWWRVQWKDGSGAVSAWSAPSWFETGNGEWTAGWIGGGNLLRRTFQLAAAPRRARAYVTGIGYYELSINGRRVGRRVLDPGFTQYERRVLYSTYDVTDLLRAGDNEVRVMLGNGWYGQTWKGRPAARLEIHGDNGLLAATGSGWQAAAGPIVEDGVYLGETYDARRENPVWGQAEVFDLKPVMSAQAMPAIEVIDSVAPHSMSSPAPGAYVFDMGQNMSGWARIRVRGESGRRVRIRYAESLHADGTLDTDNLRYARATDYYILRGDAEGEEWEPRFTYHGFRYVEVTGLAGPASLETVRGRVVHSKMRQTGTFASSKQILNDIARLTLWTLRGNWMSIPTDGAQRDERMGWMADAHLASESAMLYFDTEALYANFLRNIADEQGPNGEVPDVAPHKTFGQKRGDPAWASGYPLMAWYSWQQFGDRRVLERHFEGMRRWADFLSTQASGELIDYSYYGDWVALDTTPGPLVSSVYYYVSVDTVAKAAGVLGRSVEEAKYHALADRIRTAFVKRWPPSDTTQAASVLPLWFGITPAADEKKVLQDLVNRIIYGSNTHLTTGIHGTKYVFPLLTRGARSELSYDLMTAEDYPSFGYMIAKGATTFWEIWQHRTGPRMNSHNHPAFAAAGAWLIEGPGGINLDPAGPGYARVRVEPQIFRDMKWASASIDTPRGEVRCEWKRIDGGAEVRVRIPVGSTASIHIPKLLREKVEVFEGGRAVWRNDAFVPGAAGLSGARQTGYPVHTVIFEAGSGEYAFLMRNELAAQ